MIAFAILEISFGEILADIPHDAGALVVYAVLAAFVGFIWYGGRSREGRS